MLGDGNRSYTGGSRRGARGTADIVADILLLCGEWTKRTRIMYRANLSHQMLKFYLWHTVDLGLLEESDGSKFRITERGQEFLSHYQSMSRLLAGMDNINKYRHIVAQHE